MGPLTKLAREHQVLLSGSLLAVPIQERATAARYFAHHGHWVHADVIEGSFRGQPGLSLTELEQLAPVAQVLDIHLMVDCPIATMRNLPVTPRRLTVQMRSLAGAAEVMDLGRDIAGEFWIAIEGLRSRDLETLKELNPDGVLVMLTPPGSAGHEADLERLNTVRAVDTAHFSAGADGGITPANLHTAASAGVRYAVSGRAFFHELSQEMPHVGRITA